MAEAGADRSSSPPVVDPVVVLAVACGGALGAVLRHLVGTGGAPGALPWHTLGVNAAGSLLLGVLAGVLATRETARWVRPLLGTGLLGGFTTYSTFATEVVLRAPDHPVVAATYVVLTLLLAVGLAATGLLLGRSLATTSGPPR